VTNDPDKAKAEKTVKRLEKIMDKDKNSIHLVLPSNSLLYLVI